MAEIVIWLMIPELGVLYFNTINGYVICPLQQSSVEYVTHYRYVGIKLHIVIVQILLMRMPYPNAISHKKMTILSINYVFNKYLVIYFVFNSPSVSMETSC